MSLIEIGKTVTVFLGIGVALYGIDSWRREHIGKRKVELCEDVLALFYEAVDAINHIRHPVSFKSETDNIEKQPGETSEQYKARKDASIVFERYNENLALFNKIYAMRYRFMAQLGKDKAKPFEDLRSIISEINSSARILARLWARNNFRTDQAWDDHQKKVEKYEAIFWEGTEEDDPIISKLVIIINDIEAICKSEISGQGSLYSLLNMNLKKLIKR